MNRLLITFIAVHVFQSAAAQAELGLVPESPKQLLWEKTGVNDYRNLVKLNLTSPIVKNYSIQYERVINKFLSVAVSGRMMPASRLPFRAAIQHEIMNEENELISDALGQARFSNFALTPEVRFYLGHRGYGRGFYIAPYYRIARYKIHRTELNYEVSDDEHYSVNISGKLNASTGGILFGAQWNLTNHLLIDWWIAGPNLGSGKGTVSGITSQPLTQEAKDELKRQLEEMDIPFTKKTVYVDDNGARMDLAGPWAGVRAGLLLGFRF